MTRTAKGWMVLGCLGVSICLAAASPPPAEDEEPLLLRLRASAGPTGAPMIATGVPPQPTGGELPSWAWLARLDDATVELVRACWPALNAADDRIRKERLLPLFELAVVVATPPPELGIDEVPTLASRLVQARHRAVEELAAARRAGLQSCLQAKLESAGVEPDRAASQAAEVAAAIDAVMVTSQGVSFADVLRCTSVDVGTLAYELVRSHAISAESALIVQTQLHDAMPKLAELRRAHDRALERRLEAGAAHMLLARWIARHDRDAAGDRWQALSSERRRTLAQETLAAKQIGEAQGALVDALVAALPAADSEALRIAYLRAAYGDLAFEAWDPRPIIQSIAGELTADRKAEADRVGNDGHQQSRSLQLEVQRVADRYWQERQASGRLDESAWAQARAKMASLLASQRAAAEVSIASVMALLPSERQGDWQPTLDRWRADAEARASTELDGVEPWLTGPNPVIRHSRKAEPAGDSGGNESR